MTDALLQEAPWVRRLAHSLAANPHDAADLEQDIWHAAIARRGETPRSLRAWLTGTARKLAAFRARCATRARAREAAAAVPEVLADDGATLAAKAELHRRLLDAVDALPEQMREAILLRYFEQLPPKEIAGRLGVSVNTVHTRLQRGRERLRADLDRSYDRRAAWTALALVDWRGNAAATGVATPSCCAASTKIGPCTAHWPPPEGTKKFSTPPAMNAQKPRVAGVATATKPSERTKTRSVWVMSAMIPA